MTSREPRNETSPQDIAAFTKDINTSGAAKSELTDSERNEEFFPKPLVKIVNYATGAVVQASLAQLNQQMRDFRKVILLIEDEPEFSGACAGALHELGYDGVQLITSLGAAEQHLDDIVSNLTTAPMLLCSTSDLAWTADSPC